MVIIIGIFSMKGKRVKILNVINVNNNNQMMEICKEK